jgi:hypothetical protein
VSGRGSISLYSVDGRKVREQEIIIVKGENKYQIDKPTQPGIYLLSMESNGRQLYNSKLIID